MGQKHLVVGNLCQGTRKMDYTGSENQLEWQGNYCAQPEYQSEVWQSIIANDSNAGSENQLEWQGNYCAQPEYQSEVWQSIIANDSTAGSEDQ
jgi:hypothetical protein